MSSASILGVIQHYQKSIEHSQDDEGRLLHCINKLYKLPVKVEHLQETGVGKTVNSLRKYNGEIGVAAKALVTKWKAMVAAEEEPAEVNNCNDDDDMNNTNGNGSSDDDRHNHSERKPSPQEHTHSNTLTENTSKDRQNKHRDKSNSEHKSKSHSESKTHKHEHSTTKRKRDVEQEEKELLSLEKKSKHEDRKNEGKNRENDRHKSSDEKSSRHREHGEKQNSNRDAKTTSSSTTHHKNSGDSKEKRENVKGAKSSEHSSSTRRETNSTSEKTSKQGESEKHRSSKDKDRHERSKENKHDKSKSSSKDTSHRDKHHNSSASHSSSTNKKPSTTTNEQATPSSTHTKDESRNSSRKRQQDSDSNDSTPTKAKISKTPKAIKQKVAATDNEEDDIDADEGIDSSMGANFADVLGMLNVPTKKAKKSLSTNKSPTVSTSSRSTSNDKASSSSSKSARAEYKPSPISSASTSTKPVDAKPDLLSASAKLAPLDPNIALELPTISANYKPLPHNKTVMDCIYRNSSVLSTPKPVRTLTDAEALSHGISSKTMRTKIYSGVRTGQILQVPSLFDLCIRVLQKNIDGLEYTGGVPFDVLRPILDRATPQQLLTFEEYNPYLMEDSDCLWQTHVQRNYRSKKRLEMESWREMYLRCEEEKEQKLNSLTATIKQSQKVIAAPVRKTQLAFVDSMVKPPRSVMRKQEQFGTKAKLVATPAARVSALSSVTPNAGKVGDTRLRVAATVRDAAQVSHAPMRAKKAPLMAKTLQFMRGRHKR